MRTLMAGQLLQLSQELNEEHEVEGVLRVLLAHAAASLHAAGGLACAAGGIQLFLDGDQWQPLEPQGETTAAALRDHFPAAHVIEVVVPARYAALDARIALFWHEPYTLGGTEEAQLEALAEVATPALEHAFAYRRLQQVSRRLVDAQEAERRRLARELHDSAGQMLTALKLGLSLLQRRQDSSSPDAPLLAEAVELVDAVHEEIRAISQALQPPQLAKLGLNESLRGLSHDFARQSGLSIVYEGEEMPPLDERASTALYRLLQEALVNVEQHAQAQRVVVWLVAARDGVTLSVHDDGVGIGSQRAEGAGLAGLRERFELIGGRIDLGVPPGGGTIVVGRVPVGKREEVPDTSEA